MLICLFERRITFLHLVINWVGSFFGNWLGALFSAYFLSYLPGGYDQDPLYSYMCYVHHSKTSYGFGECFLRGIGCNALVCLAVWNVTGCDDPASKILSLWFPIVSFCVAGYEHIIANLYTLQLTLMMGCPGSLADVIVKNLIPTFLGNVVGGCVLIGAVYWYNFYPIEEYSHKQITPGSAAAAAAADADNDFPISRVHSRASVSPSIIGLGAKPNTAFGGAAPPQTQWNSYDHVKTHSESISNVGSAPAVKDISIYPDIRFKPQQLLRGSNSNSNSNSNINRHQTFTAAAAAAEEEVEVEVVLQVGELGR
ncbi:formate/nitrite transporter, putative [Eimeria acervulina]|uniref:Formate/nitrite transporter, putative n=1 Tax=Eimeria acervulina TaxID=5801 RepID=U6GBU0_EIMAC|nr:formate/nitrite transporter, putative [Eimeria acervulina]CDI76813.1 formate/nitrite transporter, putative [Eimeria acervulina]